MKGIDKISEAILTKVKAEAEIRNLRLTLKAMFDNIPVEEIRNYLVLP